MPQTLTPTESAPATIVALDDLPAIRDAHGGMRALCRAVLSEPTDDMDKYGKPVMDHALADRVQCALHASKLAAHAAYARAEGRTLTLSKDDIAMLASFQASGTTPAGFLATILPTVRAMADNARLAHVALPTDGKPIELPANAKAVRTPEGHALHIALPKGADAETKSKVQAMRKNHTSGLRAHQLVLDIESALMSVKAAEIVFRAVVAEKRKRVAAGPSRKDVMAAALAELPEAERALAEKILGKLGLA
jgi:hypothetical protein